MIAIVDTENLINYVAADQIAQIAPGSRSDRPQWVMLKGGGHIETWEPAKFIAAKVEAELAKEKRPHDDKA
jgi:hypothetical protein